MVGIIDPPRTGLRDAVDQVHKAGIHTVMITDLDIIRTGEASSMGNDLNKTDQEELDRTTAEVPVYARVVPEHKLKIIDCLRRQENIVAMTGDEVNDAPAVKAADIGVAMGITGTEVIKDSAKMIMADNNFANIVHVVRVRKAIFDNFRKFLCYLLSSNMGEVFTVFGDIVFTGLIMAAVTLVGMDMLSNGGHRQVIGGHRLLSPDGGGQNYGLHHPGLRPALQRLSLQVVAQVGLRRPLQQPLALGGHRPVRGSPAGHLCALP